MPSYNLLFTDGERHLRDLGAELDDTGAAMDYAVQAAQLLIAQTVLGNVWARWRMELSDADGRVVLTVPLAQIQPGTPPAAASDLALRRRH